MGKRCRALNDRASDETLRPQNLWISISSCCAVPRTGVAGDTSDWRESGPRTQDAVPASP